MSGQMSLLEPRLVPHEAFGEVRPRLTGRVRFEALWTAGDLAGLARPTVAIVGSRAPSEAGRRLSFETARSLARAEFCVVSGLALGIDGAAHAGALDAGGATVGVLGGGHRCFHPRRNRILAERMCATGGAVVSPYAPDEPARPFQFLQRNGIVAALADAVVIVEAAARSGALNTASWAADLGIPVFVFPGDVDRPKVAGCLALLRDGATLVRDAADILADLGYTAAQLNDGPRLPFNDAALTPLEVTILDRLREGEASVDHLLSENGRGAPEVMSALTRLEIEGLIERRPGLRYARRGAG
jgi:DNA processing protein